MIVGSSSVAEQTTTQRADGYTYTGDTANDTVHVYY